MNKNFGMLIFKIYVGSTQMTIIEKCKTAKHINEEYLTERKYSKYDILFYDSAFLYVIITK